MRRNVKIITRYILRQFLPIFGLAMSAFVGLYLIIDFFEKMDDILGGTAPLGSAFLYFLYRCPSIITQGIPLVVLLAVVITLGILKRNRELIALRAAGVSPYVYAGPIVVMALMFSIAEFWMGESMARPMDRAAQQIWDYQIRGHETPILWSQENVWYWGKDAIYHIHLYDQRRRALENVTVFYLNPEFNLRQRIDAKQIRWIDHEWVANNGVVINLTGSGPQQQWFTTKTLHLPETPEDFKSIEAVPEDLSWENLYHYTSKLRNEDYVAAPYEVELHRRIAFPVMTFILALLGINIALRQRLHGGIASGAILALLLAFAYLTLSQIGCSLATSGLLPAAIGVWTVNVAFAGLTCFLWLTNDQ